MPDFNHIFLYRMAHIENIPHILRFGFTHIQSQNANEHYRSIGDERIIQKRNNFLLKNGHHLGNYIPFYFGVRMPMLYIIQKGLQSVSFTPPEQIVYCVTSVGKILENQYDFLFTNGHALDAFSSQFGQEAIGQVEDIIDFEAVKAKYWKDESDFDLKRRKEAEFLVLGDMHPNVILGFIVYDQVAKNELIRFGVSGRKIRIDLKSYF